MTSKTVAVSPRAGILSFVDLKVVTLQLTQPACKNWLHPYRPHDIGHRQGAYLTAIPVWFGGLRLSPYILSIECSWLIKELEGE